MLLSDEILEDRYDVNLRNLVFGRHLNIWIHFVQLWAYLVYNAFE